jgi:AraC family transcriptional regulator of adaptative response / methylphosphotriester-DNA alkyltransferase methyltransferase
MKSDERYVAIINRSVDLSTSFFYGVSSTKIFCLPSCPSKTPKEENVEYFVAATLAITKGYRPCKRCRPLEGSELPTNEYHRKIYEEVLARAKANPRIKVQELARDLTISERQLRRIIQSISNLSTKRFVMNLRER